MPFIQNAAPAGWLAANGDTIPNGFGTVQGNTADFSALYAVLGSGIYGPAGKLPDLRGYFVRGAGTNIDGVASGTYGAKQADAFQAHEHTQAYFSNAGASATGSATAGIQYAANRSTQAIVAKGTNGTPRTAAETRPCNIAMLYCIKI
jgi:microcystin-dependent protein